jgi:hypothetical protein
MSEQRKAFVIARKGGGEGDDIRAWNPVAPGNQMGRNDREAIFGLYVEPV